MSRLTSGLQTLCRPSREKLVLLGVSLVGWATIGAFFVVYGYGQTWRLWGIESRTPFFLDLRLIAGTVQTLHMGLDPTVQNPGDPTGRLFNYPGIWYILAHTNLSQADTLTIGVVLIVLFFAGSILFPGKLSKSAVILMVLILFSPAAMLLYERANVDLLIFFLCAAAIAASEIAILAAAVLIVFAAVLKLFPFAGLSVFVSRGRRIFLAVLSCSTALVALYLLLTYQNLRASLYLTQRGDHTSYGADVFFMHFAPPILALLRRILAHGSDAHLVFLWFPYAVAWLILLIFAWIGLRSPDRLVAASRRNLDAFWMGGTIFVGTFVLGSNWDYRLVFLLFLVPQLSEWCRQSSTSQRAIAIAVMGLVLLSCWNLFYDRSPHVGHETAYEIGIFVLDEVVNWLLYAGTAYLLGASAPGWLAPVSARQPALADGASA